jgi:glycosyltransferase involved in cell wall biosynthesis
METTSQPRKKKILYIITKSNWGGAQRHVFDLAVSLPKTDFETTVVLGGKGPLKEKLEAAGIRIISINALGRDLNTIKDSWSSLVIFKIIKKEKPDILHLHSSKVGGLGALTGRILGVKKIIFTVHGWAFKEKRGRFQKKILFFISWLTMLLSHKTISVSDDDYQKAPRFLVGKKLLKIKNGVSTIKFLSQMEARAILDIALPPDTLIAGIIAELHRNKGLEFAIAALADIEKSGNLARQIKLAIIGSGEEQANLEKLTENLGLKNSVRLLGPKENAASFLKAFDIFILPSIKEGMPYSLLEAGLAELPSIASRVGGVPEIIDDMDSGILIKPGDYKEISFALRFLSQHPEKMAMFGRKLAEKVRREFSFDETLKRVLAVYAD